VDSKFYSPLAAGSDKTNYVKMHEVPGALLEHIGRGYGFSSRQNDKKLMTLKKFP